MTSTGESCQSSLLEKTNMPNEDPAPPIQPPPPYSQVQAGQYDQQSAGPYGQQPAPYGQQPGPYGQQPGPYGQPYPQQGPYQQQGPYPPQGLHGQQPGPYGNQQYQQTTYNQQPGAVPQMKAAPVITVRAGAGDPHTVVMAPCLQNPPPDHLIFNIVVTIFCCWPIGICAIMKSLATRNAVNRADAEEAMILSKRARKLGHWTLCCGIVFILLMIGIRIIIPMLN